MINRLPKSLLGIAAGLICAPSALWTQNTDAAQTTPETPAFEVGVGFSLSSPRDVNQHPLCDQYVLPCTSPRTFPDGGVTLTAARNLNSWFAVVGEVSAYSNGYVGTDNHTTTNHVYAYLAGGRARFPLSGGAGDWLRTVRVFGQLLAGNVSSEAFPAGGAIQPGVGADFRTSHSFDIRIEYDHTYLPGKPRDLPGDRILAAIVLGFGQRE